MADLLNRALEKLKRFWNGAEPRVLDPHTRLIETGEFSPPDSEFGVEILNDHTTPMEFVVEQLVAHVGLSKKDALHVMLNIHLKGGVLLPLPSEADASRVATSISIASSQSGHPLVCRPVDFRASRSAT